MAICTGMPTLQKLKFRITNKDSHLNGKQIVNLQQNCSYCYHAYIDKEHA